MRNKILMTLALLIIAATRAWADGIVCTASDLGKVLCTDGSIYENVSAAETAGKTAAAVIAYVDETNKNGLALALADEGANLWVPWMYWDTAVTTAAAHTPAITGGTWKLPSQAEWKQMFSANGGNEDSYTGLNTALSTAGGNILKESGSYWSSSEVGENASKVYFDSGNTSWSQEGKNGAYSVRACLEFDIADPNAIDVTTNAASEQDLFTEASFKMPTNDVDVNYMLVRDMQDETNPVAFSGLPSSGNIIVKKGSDGKYQPAEALTIQLIDPLAAAEAQNIIAADGITIKVLVGAENELGAIDFDQDNPITFEDFLADMKPGYYWIKAEPTDENSPYDGTVYSQEFLVSNGYELTIAAGEYATFYKDEKLYVEDEDAVLYTVANVTDTEAQLSDAIKVAPANTPLLVYNKSEQEKTFLLIPTTDKTPDNVTAATQFVGKLEATTIPASATGADNYALNGYAFVWVKDAIEVGANKCWLHIASQPAAARAMTRSIVGGNGTTGIDAIENVTIDNEGWYDLQGRKLQAKPNRGGIYIHNGRKVVVH